MGTSSTLKRPARRVTLLIKILSCKFSIFRAVLRPLVILGAFGALAGNIFSQNLDVLAEQIKRGNDEQKRTALVQIRNLENADASRLAIPLLRDASEIVRATAAFSVIFLSKDEAFAVLIPQLTDKKEFVRRETAYALGKIQNTSAIAPLMQSFQNKKEKSVEVKNAAVIALGEIGDASAVDFLTQILRRKPTAENDFERRSAARSIGQIAQIIQTGKSKVITPPDGFAKIELPKYPNLSAQFPVFSAALPVLTQILQNPTESDDAKRESAFALGAIGDVSAAAILQTNLRAEDYYLAAICAEALQKIALQTKINRAE